jgi:hypothetical protein
MSHSRLSLILLAAIAAMPACATEPATAATTQLATEGPSLKLDSGLTVMRLATAQPTAEAPSKGFLRAFLLARDHDPTYQTAKAEKQANQAMASAARAAYFPQVVFSRAQSEMEAQPRKTITVSQPLISVTSTRPTVKPPTAIPWQS